MWFVFAIFHPIQIISTTILFNYNFVKITVPMAKIPKSSDVYTKILILDLRFARYQKNRVGSVVI